MPSGDNLDLRQLGARLRSARKHAGLRQAEAAEVLAITPSALSQYETGKRRIDALMLDRLSRLYGVPVSYFFAATEGLPAPGWEAGLRQLARDLTVEAKAGIGELVARVRALEELYERTGAARPGRPHPPFAALPSAEFSDYEVAEHAERARRHFALGTAPVLDMKAFLEAHGYLVFAVSLGDDDSLAGLYFEHPDLGKVAVLAEDRPYAGWSFTLAHQFAHGLFHYDRPAILCRVDDPRPLEHFADAFAGFFLVPGEALHEQLAKLGRKTVARVEELVVLARHFGIGFEAMAERLQRERRLDIDPAELAAVRPVALARALGFRTTPQEFGHRPLPLEERFPRKFLELAYRAVKDNVLSLRRVAELLGVSHLELEERLEPTEDAGVRAKART